jgi:hypothetical protein
MAIGQGIETDDIPNGTGKEAFEGGCDRPDAGCSYMSDAPFLDVSMPL